ncbi:ATP-binding cassette sub-family A member 1 [Bagarius yarrelli]|uniref:P-type phospholipid transporter n=1 Tax=Bagarius yarrelli TaxID=175774 RepID=A0A556U5L9_BAGYA|nr:ATP-binding cassette sub-family A member 1 [Bagarius yarrelli]
MEKQLDITSSYEHKVLESSTKSQDLDSFNPIEPPPLDWRSDSSSEACSLRDIEEPGSSSMDAPIEELPDYEVRSTSCTPTKVDHLTGQEAEKPPKQEVEGFTNQDTETQATKTQRMDNLEDLEKTRQRLTENSQHCDVDHACIQDLLDQLQLFHPTHSFKNPDPEPEKSNVSADPANETLPSSCMVPDLCAYPTCLEESPASGLLFTVSNQKELLELLVDPEPQEPQAFQESQEDHPICTELRATESHAESNIAQLPDCQTRYITRHNEADEMVSVSYGTDVWHSPFQDEFMISGCSEDEGMEQWQQSRCVVSDESVSHGADVAPEGESQPMAEVDLFISTQRIKVLSADTQEAMMDHSLQMISYIADIGDLVVLMVRRKPADHKSADSASACSSSATKKCWMICHVFSSEDAQIIAQAIGQAFGVAYQHFLQTNELKSGDFQGEYCLGSQELYNGDLVHFSQSENIREVCIIKKVGEILGIAVVESGWGSILPTVVVANLLHGGIAERSGELSIGDRIMSVNGASLVGLPITTCHSIIRDLKNQSQVKLSIVHCPPVTMAIIKRPNPKYQLGFSVEDGIICSLMRGGIAERGGIRVGHRIIEINGQSVVATPHEKIIHILTNAVGEVQLIIELLWPLFLFFILIAVRYSHPPYKHSQCHFPNKALPSAGTLAWVQGIICNIKNPCFHYPTPGETPGDVGNFNNSILSRLVMDGSIILTKLGNQATLSALENLSLAVQKLGQRQETWPNLPVREYLRANETFSSFLRTNCSLPPSAVDQLLKAQLNLQVMSLARAGMRLSDIVCNATLLDRYLTVEGNSSFTELQQHLCSVPSDLLQQAEQIFLSQLNVSKIITRERLRANAAEVRRLGLAVSAVAQEFSSLINDKSVLSSFTELNSALRLISPEHSSAPPLEGFQAFSKIMCGRADVGGEKIPSFNWYEDQDIKSFLGKDGTEKDDLEDDNTTTPFCKNMIQTLESNPLSRIVWRGIKPLLIGKLLYTPDTPATQRIMNEVNRTFQDFEVVAQMHAVWEEVGPKLKSFMESSVEIRILQDLLRRPEVAFLVNLQLTNTSWTASRIAHFLSMPDPETTGTKEALATWLDVYQGFNSTISLLSQLTKCFSLGKRMATEGIATEGQLVERALELLEDRQFWAGIVFLLPDNSSSDLPPHVKYKIRMDIDDVTRTNKIKDKFWDPGPAAEPFSDLRYIWGGFVYVQDLVERAITHVMSGKQPTTGIYVQQMPYPCFVDDVFLRVLNRSLPLFMTLAWIYSVAMIIKGVVYEKEARLKETMKIMGLGSGTLWLSWFINSYLPFLFSSGLLITALKLGDILPYSDPAVIFFFLSAFATATIMLCFLISTFFSRANLAAASGGLIYFSLYLPYVLCVAWREYLTSTHRILASFISPVAFGFGCEYFSQYEEQGVGIQWFNLLSSPAEGDEYNFTTSIIMLYVDAFIYGVATWYIEAVFPGQYGIPRPWNFLFKLNYWGGLPLEVDMPIPPIPCDQPENHIEPDPSHLVLGVAIHDLVKIYKKKANPAVNHLSLKFYEGQITSFLGHNGAGKTTTMSILTGLFPPTAGTVYIKGKDIRTDMDIIRRHLGVCPQHNVLFPMLTVEEHAWFYGRLKGMSNAEVNKEMSSLLEDVGLLHKRHEQTKNLSGGMQRKLSVAIAFIGDSKVVVLDEPTAGVDPYSRRGIWDLLLKYRKGYRTIILSTHYMDEADLLGDRIAIISQGKLCCCGSPLFLKARLGTGYYLTVVKKALQNLTPSSENAANFLASTLKESDSSMSEDTGLGNEICGSDVSGLVTLAQHYIAKAKLVKDVGKEAVINFPHAASEDGTLAFFLAELEKRQTEFGIVSYGLSDTTLEEIFLKVAEETGVDAELEGGEGEQPAESNTDATETDPLSSNLQSDMTLTGWRLTWQQLRALFIKRLTYALRSRRGFIAQIVLPAVFVLVALLFSLIVPPFGKYPALELQPWMYGEQYTFFSNDDPENPEIQNLLDALLDPPGFGTKCMESDIDSQCENSKAETVFLRPQISYETWQLFNKGNWTDTHLSPDCECSTENVRRMLPECPVEAGGLPPPQMKKQTGDLLQNLTGRNISDFLIKTYPKILKKSMKTKKWVNEFRYGGFSLGGKSTQTLTDIQELQQSVMSIRTRYNLAKNSSLDQLLDRLPSLLTGISSKNNVKVWFNNKGWHAMVSFVNIMNNGLLRASLPPGADRRKHGITAYNHPLNLTKEQLTELALMTTSVDVLVSICVIFAMSFVPASFVLFLIEERVSKSKHLQFVSGVKPILYWTANFLWDMLNYTVPATMVVFIFLSFQQQSYVSEKNLPALVLLLLLYGWSITPLMYPASFMFSVPSTAYVVLTSVNLFIGINGSIATFVLELFVDEHLNEVNRILKKVFLIFPHFCLGRGLIDMAKNQAMADAFQRLGNKHLLEPLSWDFVGKNLFAMAVEGVVFFIFTLLLQTCSELRLPPLGPDDEDVANERNRVQSNKTQGDILTIRDLSKVYKAGKRPAVNRLCLSIPRGECFGLLGVNGAGKTSTFRMLTGDTPITYGDAFLNNYSVLRDMDRVHQLMGYCPQFDAISDLLTGREHLEFYARLRGVPEPYVAKVSQWGVKKLGLTQYAEQEAGGYSGGNKRKLSTAISLIGAPPVVFLDEPTTGMDPKAKRFLWNCILSIIKEGRAVVLTSHSMEECEALCTRMAIMVNGRFQCLGSVQHLKNRFGDGYTIILRLSAPSPDPCPVDAHIQSCLPGVKLKERHHNVLQYQLPSHACSLARVFDILSNSNEELGIAEYSVSQTTLDQVRAQQKDGRMHLFTNKAKCKMFLRPQVFVNFAKEQIDDDDDEDGQLKEVVGSDAVQSSQTVCPLVSPVKPRRSVSQVIAAQKPQRLSCFKSSQPGAAGSKTTESKCSKTTQPQQIQMQPLVDFSANGLTFQEEEKSKDLNKLFVVKT